MKRSRLVLGTAQLGTNYGVANTRGAPTETDAFAILDAAYDAGINTFDTAPAYGSAEAVLGKWIEVHGYKSVHVVTKIWGDEPASARKEVEASLSRLRVQKLDGCLLHAPQNMYKADVMNSLMETKKAGLVSNIGVSVYDEVDALHALELEVDYIQVPYNAFDQRLDATDFFERAKKHGVTVFARSPFLQGLLLMKSEHLPPHLTQVRPYLEQFTEIAKRHDLSQLEAAFGFAYRHCRADHIVFGVDTAVQLKEITSASERLSAEHAPWIDEIVSAFQTMDRTITDPRSWKTV